MFPLEEGPLDPGSTELQAAADALESLTKFDLHRLSNRELLTHATRVEVLSRRVESLYDQLVSTIDTTGAHAEDGHFNPRSFLKGTCRTDGPTAHRRQQIARALPKLPNIAAAYGDGEIPVANMAALARVVANPRVQEHLDEDFDKKFCQIATSLDADTFADVARTWERQADADGAERRDDANHRRRRFGLHQLPDGSWEIRGNVGSLQGAAIEEVFNVFTDAETRTDIDAAKARLGDDFTMADLARTPAQRRADALAAIFGRAGANLNRPSEPMVNIVIDEETFNLALARAAGADPDITPDPFDSWCHTLTGAQLSLGDVVEAALRGHIRRVVIDGDGTVINLGRKQRLFTGNSRIAALLADAIRHRGRARCFHPGCDVKTCHLQVDHDKPARAGGRTDQDNAQPACGGHNRLRTCASRERRLVEERAAPTPAAPEHLPTCARPQEAGYRPLRRPDGTWDHVRPDGTTITAAV